MDNTVNQQINSSITQSNVQQIQETPQQALGNLQQEMQQQIASDAANEEKP